MAEDSVQEEERVTHAKTKSFAEHIRFPFHSCSRPQSRWQNAATRSSTQRHDSAPAGVQPESEHSPTRVGGEPRTPAE